MLLYLATKIHEFIVLILQLSLLFLTTILTSLAVFIMK